MINTYIFDMDGVLVNSEPVILESSIRGLKKYGIEAKKTDFEPFIGSGEDLFIGGVTRSYGVEYEIKMKKEIYDIYDTIVKDKIEIITGVHKLLADLKSKSFTIALASSADLRKVKSNLNAADIDEKYFDLIISGDDVENKKPSPEIYLLAAKLLNKNSNECIVIEDALNGIKAAKAADMKCIALSTSFSKVSLAKENPDHIFDDLDKLNDYLIKNNYII